MEIMHAHGVLFIKTKGKINLNSACNYRDLDNMQIYRHNISLTEKELQEIHPRMLDSIYRDAKKNKHWYEPLLHIELDHVVPDEFFYDNKHSAHTYMMAAYIKYIQ